MLHAIGFPDDQMPQLLVHGWWNLGGAKMSKSVGNIIDPFVLIDKYGSDALALLFDERHRHRARMPISLKNVLSSVTTPIWQTR